MKNLKKFNRSELKNVYGGNGRQTNSLSAGIGDGCTDACQPGDGVCAQYGLVCAPWVTTKPNGEVLTACFKCV